jgi:hypothetical protein
VDRITATKARLEEITAFARRARDAGPPCSDCRYKTLLSNCSNPAYAEPHFDAAVGSYEEMFFTPAQQARAMMACAVQRRCYSSPRPFL